MMMNRYREYLLRALPFAAAFVLFFGISALYFSPQFAGEELPQHDVVQYEGMVRDIRLQRAETGEDPQWTGGMFGGMPAYLINVAYPAQAVKNTVGAVVRVIDAPAAFLFFAMLGMWLMLLMVGVNPWVGIVAALAYGLSTYLLLIIGAGHVTKSWALVYAPLMMGGIYCTLRRNPWIGGAATALFASLQIGVNHPQITYYFLMAAALFWLSEGFFALRGKRLRDFAKRTAVLLAAGVLAVGSNFSPLWYTLQHTRDTIRGGSELAAADKSDGASGLDLEYATAWSYGPAESWNLLIPDFMGGDSMRSFSSDGEVAGALREYGLSELAGQLPAYWGDQPFTAGPTYLGAVSLFLALMGCLLARGRDKWWAIAATVLALLLAWGRHFMPFTELFFTYLPGYDKFRTVSMILVIAQWTVPLLGAVGLMYLWRNREEDRTRFRRALAWSLGVVGGLCLLFAVAGSAIFDFGRQAAEEQMTATFGNWFRQAGMTAELRQGLDAELGRTTAEAMAAERVSIMQADAWRSFVFVLLAAGAVFLYLRRWCGRGVLVALLGVWMAVDLVSVDFALPLRRRFRSGPQKPGDADGGGPADTAGQGAGISSAEPDGEPLQRCDDQLFPPLGGRLSRGQAGPLPGSDRMVPDRSGRVGAGYAQYPLCDRFARFGDPSRNVPRSRLVRGGHPRDRFGPGGDRTVGRGGSASCGGDSPGRPRKECASRTRVEGGRFRRLHPADGVSSQLPEIRIFGRPARRGGLLGDLLRQGVDGLCRRRGGARLPGRLRAAGPATACGRAWNGRVAVPGAEMAGRGERDARLVAGHSGGMRRRAGIPPRAKKKEIRE